MAKPQLTGAQRDALDAVYTEEMRNAPRFSTVAEMPNVSAELRRILVRRFPEMEATFRELGLTQ